MATQIPILTYHRIHADEDISVPDDTGRVDLSEFLRQLDALVQAGISSVTHHDLAAWLYDDRELPERAVALDFDDNRLNVFENAFPAMQERDLHGTVFTVTHLADAKPLPHMEAYPSMLWQHLTRLRDAGWCIAPHTMRHLHLAGPERGIKSIDEARLEMEGSLERVREMTGVDAPYFAYPVGSCDEELEATAKTLFKTARHWQASEPHDIPVVTKGTDPYRLTGINVAFDMTPERFKQIVATAR